MIQVRKEKLGDRIAALQQLVAPFGKVKIILESNIIIFCIDLIHVAGQD